MFSVPERLEVIHRPKHILDLRGLLMHSYHGSKDPNALLGSDGKTLIKRAGHGVEAFLERYLQPLLQSTAPIDIVAVVEGGNDVRRALYPAYKAKRREEKDKQDPRLTEQLQRLEREAVNILKYLGCIIVEVPRVEADDVIAMICNRYPGPKTVHTRDVDLGQLAVLPDTFVMLAEKLVDLDEGITFVDGGEEYVVSPKHIPLMKALVGDKSDEYKGVPGVGIKAWYYLVDKYGDEGLAEIERALIENNKQMVVDAATEYADKVLGKIAEHWDQAILCWKLACLHPRWCWMGWGGKLIRPSYTKRLPNGEKLLEALRELGIPGLYDEFKPYLATETLVDSAWLNDSRWQRMMEAIERSPAIGFDTEGFDALKHEAFKVANKGRDFVDTISQQLTGASFTFGENLQHTIYMPINHRDTHNLGREKIAEFIQAVEKKRKLLVAHNARFEQAIIEREYGIDLPDMEDTITWTSYYDENLMEGSSTSGNLKELSSLLLRHQQQEYKQVLEKAGAVDMRGVSGEEVLHYACDDALVASHLWVLYTFACALEQQSVFVEENDILPNRALSRSFAQGMEIDFDEIARQAPLDRKVIDEGMAKIRSLLETHATEVDEDERKARALRLVEADREYIELSVKQKFAGCGSERVSSEVSLKALKWAEACTYKPRVEVPREVTFVPTAKQLSAIAVNLGLPENHPAAELPSTGGKKLQEWIGNLHQLAYHSDIEFEEEIVDFLSLLGASYAQIAKRSGAEYDRLVSFCQEVAQKHAKKDWVGDELNLDSPPQMTELLYLKLGLPVRVRSKVQGGSDRHRWKLQGSPATNDKAFQMAIAEDCPEGDWRRDLLKTVKEVKAAMTRFELYWDPYPLWRHPTTGAVHGSIKNNGTVTRRPTGSQPNLLQVSKGSVRRMVIPKPFDVLIRKYNRHVIVSIDFSGQELRITGSEARDPALIEAYTGGGSYVDEDGMTRQIVKDVHSVTSTMFAMEVLRRELDEACLSALELDEFGRMSYHQFRAIVADGVLALSQLDLSEQQQEKIAKAVNNVRKMAKAVNFLICYLGTASTLAGNLGIPKAFAEQIMSAVFKSYARLGPWQDETIEFARKNGYVTTAYGTWKHVSSDILSRDGGKRSRAERQAVNQTIQGCAADILKVVLTGTEVQEVFHKPEKAVLYAPVYDEVVSSVHMDYCFEYCQTMQDLMNVTPPGHPIPMMGEVSIGLNWADQVELGDRPSERKMIELFDKWVAEAA